MNPSYATTAGQRISFHATLAFLAVNILLAVTLFAAPRVQFDLHPLVACRDVTTEEFARSHPGDRLIEAKLHVSSLIKSGDEDDLIEFFYRIQSPRGTVQVVDYSPTTSMTSTYEGSIEVQDSKERVRSLGINASGGYSHIVKGNASAELGSKNGSVTRYKIVPEMQLLSASGTMNRGTGVYFRLKPSRQTSLEGGRLFTLVLRVPRSWRADVLHVSCRAQGYERGLVRPLDEQRVSGAAVLPVSLYLAGDQHARAVVMNAAVAESRLRRIAVARRDEIDKRSYPSVAHKVGAFFAAVDPKIPTDWVQQVILDPRASSIGSFEQRLPTDVRKTAVAFIAAKARVYRLNGWR